MARNFLESIPKGIQARGRYHKDLDVAHIRIGSKGKTGTEAIGIPYETVVVAEVAVDEAGEFFVDHWLLVDTYKINGLRIGDAEAGEIIEADELFHDTTTFDPPFDDWEEEGSVGEDGEEVEPIAKLAKVVLDVMFRRTEATLKLIPQKPKLADTDFDPSDIEDPIEVPTPIDAVIHFVNDLVDEDLFLPGNLQSQICRNATHTDLVTYFLDEIKIKSRTNKIRHQVTIREYLDMWYGAVCDWRLELHVLPQIIGGMDLYNYTSTPHLHFREFLDSELSEEWGMTLYIEVHVVFAGEKADRAKKVARKGLSSKGVHGRKGIARKKRQSR